jgi:autotransporter-associated beta strand protein
MTPFWARTPLHAAVLATGLAIAGPAAAQDATWLANPGSGDFNTAANWTPAAVPTGTASFGTSTTTSLSLSNGISLGGFTFNAGASAYSFINGYLLNFTGAGIVINGGSATITNNNALNFYNTSTAGNATITNNNILNFLDTSTAGSASITNNTGNFYNASTAGNAAITNYNHLFFFDTSTAGNATITNNWRLHFFDASTAGSAAITNNIFLEFFNTSTAGSASITNNAEMDFFHASTAGNATITNNINGFILFFNTSTAASAVIINAASGAVVDFSGSTGPNNDHKLSAGSIAGAGKFYLGNDQLTVGGNNLSTTVGGVISDCGVGGIGCSASFAAGGSTGGALVKTGTGTLTLSGANTYTGATTVNGGVLDVTGSIASSSLALVNAGGILMGTGTVGIASVNSGGMLAPGSGAAGTSLTIAGSLALQSGAIYLVQVNPATASFANVTGSATLGGATVNAVFAPGSYVAKQYTILTASGGVSDAFAPAVVNTNLPANFKTDLSYDATHAYLDLVPAFTGLNVNQQNVANAIVNFFNSNGGIPQVYSALTPLGLTQASGETATGSQQTTFDAMSQFVGLITDRFSAGRAGGGSPPPAYVEEDSANAYAAAARKRTAAERDAYAMFTKAPLAQNYDPRWSVWAAGFGGAQTTDGNTAQGSNNTTSRIFGMAAGADYIFSPRTIAGFALAGGGTNFSVANGGTGRSDLFQAGAFIRHTMGAAYISGALAYGWQDITTDRTVTIAGVDRLRAQFNANAFSGRVEGGYRFVTPWMGGIGITPYAAAQFTTFDLPAYAEQVLSGANTFALAYGPKSVTDTRSELGLRGDKSFAMPNGVLTLRGRLAWAHDYNPDRSIGATFQTLPGASFTVGGAAQASDSALTSASIERKWINGWSAAGTLESEFSNVTASYAGKGVVRYAW